MAMLIQDICVNCGRCERSCPTDSISQGIDFFEIDPSTCTECNGDYDEPQCRLVCPVRGCIIKAT